MTSSARNLAVLFADVSGSTTLYEKLGDRAALAAVETAIDVMKRSVAAYRGTVVKTIGDEVMAVFPDGDAALQAASDMQNRITALPPFGDVQLAIRIGFHVGEVLEDSGDYFGDAVNTAARMAGFAKAGQIIITDAIQQRLSEQWKAVARRVDIAVPRGQHEEVTIFEVLWQHGETTSMLPAIATITELQKQFRIRLRYLGEELLLDPRERTTATLGRGQENDLVIKGNLISRLHARVEASKDRFTLVDASTNGTFVRSSSGEELYIRRETLPLTGEGIIGLGRVAQPDSDLAVHYRVEE